MKKRGRKKQRGSIKKKEKKSRRGTIKGTKGYVDIITIIEKSNGKKGILYNQMERKKKIRHEKYLQIKTS